MRANAQVTTTSSIDGWLVESYLGVVASHVVAGTGFGSDFLASFSDFFGGRSGAYQNQLASIYAEAIEQLHRKAEHLGGNWIVGLRVDMDEVSGKGSQMFMVTAMGTAVLASPEPTGDRTRTVAGHAAALEVQRMQRRLEIAGAVRTNQLFLDDQTWEFIVDQRVDEAAPAVLDWASKLQAVTSWQQIEESLKRRTLAFFSALPTDTATSILHDALCGEASIANVAISIMRDLSLVNLQTSLQGLRSTNPELRRRVVQVLGAHQQTYVEGDVEVMDDLIRELPLAFEESPEIVQAKGLLGGKKDKWICESCGHQNSVGSKRCGKCAKDVRGFFVNEITPEKAASILGERRKALAALFRTDSSHHTGEQDRDSSRTTALIG
jgi:uncharacterized protein YbjQ (UPF0145 family)